jgi:hypothetical protein
MLDKILYVVIKSAMCLITIVCFITRLRSGYNDQFIPLLSQFLLVSHRINKFMGPIMNCTTTWFNQLCWNWISTW